MHHIAGGCTFNKNNALSYRWSQPFLPWSSTPGRAQLRHNEHIRAAWNGRKNIRTPRAYGIIQHLKHDHVYNMFKCFWTWRQPVQVCGITRWLHTGRETMSLNPQGDVMAGQHERKRWQVDDTMTYCTAMHVSDGLSRAHQLITRRNVTV